MDVIKGIEERLIKLILEKVNHDSLALKEIMNYACRKEFFDVVTYLLENIDHEKLDIMEAINDAYRSMKNFFRDYYGYEHYINDKRIKKSPNL